jgi:hypothetical protein
LQAQIFWQSKVVKHLVLSKKKKWTLQAQIFWQSKVVKHLVLSKKKKVDFAGSDFLVAKSRQASGTW